MRNGHKYIGIRLGLTVRNLRLRQKLTQEELAHRALLHRTYLTDIERGIRNPSVEVVEKLANGLGITLAELFRLSDTIVSSSKQSSRRNRM